MRAKKYGVLVLLALLIILLKPADVYAQEERGNSWFELIGHRGLSGEAPDNTMQGINLALEKVSVRGIAVDPRLTKDNKLILCHDKTVAEYIGKKIAVSSKPLKYFKMLHYQQKWLNRKYGRKKYRSADVSFASFDEAVKAVKKYNDKHPKSRKTLYIKLSTDEKKKVEYYRAILDTLNKNEFSPRDVVFWSMGEPYLKGMYRKCDKEMKKYATFELCLWTYDMADLLDATETMVRLRNNSMLSNANLCLYIWGCGNRSNLFNDVSDNYRKIELYLNVLRKNNIDIVYGRLDATDPKYSSTMTNLKKLGINKVVTVRAE